MLRIALTPLALAAVAPSLAAQTAPAPATQPTAQVNLAAGATVYDTAGNVVGTIESVTPQAAVVSTGAMKGALPLTAFVNGPKGPTIALTKAQLEAATQQAAATSGDRLKTQLTSGAQVKGSAGNVVGTVRSADAQLVTLTTAKGDVRLPINGFAPGPDGPVIGMTADQLDAAIAAGPAAPTSAATSDAAASTSTKASTTTKKVKTIKKRR